MELNRELQGILLRRLRDVYPRGMTLGPVNGFSDLAANICYLAEHGLLVGRPIRNADGITLAPNSKITAKGLDFLADDGGLSAILGVQTVKIHEDTLRQLLAVGIESMPAPEEKKSALREAIKSAPASALNETIRATVALALREAPGALQTLQSIFLQGV